jgi:hypothetical protein
MKTTLTITVLGSGINDRLLKGVEQALRDYYPEKFGRCWGIDIDVIPETPEDEIEAAAIRGEHL